MQSKGMKIQLKLETFGGTLIKVVMFSCLFLPWTEKTDVESQEKLAEKAKAGTAGFYVELENKRAIKVQLQWPREKPLARLRSKGEYTTTLGA